MADQCKATARVKVMLEIDVDSNWGGDCQLDQVYKQGATAAVNVIQKLVQNSSCRIRLIGDPIVRAVITERTQGGE